MEPESGMSPARSIADRTPGASVGWQKRCKGVTECEHWERLSSSAADAGFQTPPF